MHITELRIRNFRNFIKAKFCFTPGVNTLIGENGSGKTNVFQALRILLDESLERNAIYFKESDFCRDLGPWQGHWIIISAGFAELDPSEGCQLLRHNAGHMNGSNTGTCTFLFRPKKDVRKQLFELSGQPEEIARYLKTVTINDYEPGFTGRSTGDCLDDDMYTACTGNFEAGTCPDPEQDDQDVLGVRIQPVYQEVACTFVRALRDVITDLRGFRGNPLLTLLRGMESDIEIADSSRITGQVRSLNQDISSLEEIKKLANDIEGALKKAVGHTYGPNVDIMSALPDSMEKLLQKLCVLIGDGSTSEYRGELQEQSLGAANLIYLALKLLEYERKLSTDRVAHFFLIEEPEAHIHTHIQKTIFANLPSVNTQVIVSTHSTHISSASKIASVNVLAKKDDHAEVYQPANGLSSKETKRIERYLDAVRSTLLFAKGVVLVEGDAELIMIPAILKAVFGVTPDELGFSVISMSSAVFEHVSVLFSDDRIQRSCAIVTDADRSLNALPADPEEDSKEQSHARSAQMSGALRHTKLIESTSGNPWTKAFFATYTFEADFIQAGNSREVVEALDEIYSDPKSKNKSKILLESEDPAEAGGEVLRLALKEGKGWFAVLLAENLSAWTFIPNYILRAISFACYPSVNNNALRRMAEYRVVATAATDSELANVLQSLVGRQDLNASDYVAAFRKAAPEDDFSQFCQYLEEYTGSND